MMSYIKSDAIEVFPSTKRGSQYARQSRLLTEKSFARLINQLVDRDSFIINFDADQNQLEFNIHGYYFKINLRDAGLSNRDVYAHIFINNTTQELEGLDSKLDNKEYEEYTGLIITDSNFPSDIDGYSRYSLKLGHVSEGVFQVETLNKIIFEAPRIKITTIDSGTI